MFGSFEFPRLVSFLRQALEHELGVDQRLPGLLFDVLREGELVDLIWFRSDVVLSDHDLLLLFLFLGHLLLVQGYVQLL